MLIKLSSKSGISNYTNHSPQERMERAHNKFPHIKRTAKVILGRDEDHIDYMTLRDKNAPPEDKKEFKKRVKNIVGGQVAGSLVGAVAGGALDKHLQKKYNVSTTPYGTIMGASFGGALGQVGGHRLTNRRLKRESATKTAAQQSQLRPGEKEENSDLDNYYSDLKKNRSYGRKLGGALGSTIGAGVLMTKTDPLSGILFGSMLGSGPGAIAGDGAAHLYTAGKHLLKRKHNRFAEKAFS